MDKRGIRLEPLVYQGKWLLHNDTSRPHTVLNGMFCIDNSNNGNDQESIQWSTTPVQGHHMEKWQHTRKHHILESQEFSPFRAGNHKAARKRQDKDKNETQITKRIHKRNTAKSYSLKSLLFPKCS